MDNHKGAIWKDFIRSEIAPARLLNGMPESADISPYVQSSAQARDEFIDGLLTEAAACRDEAQLTGMVRRYQALVCIWMDQVHGYGQVSANQPERAALYEVVSGDLEACLQFIETYFATYFDRAAFAPRSRSAALRGAISRTESLLPDAGEAPLGPLLLLELRRLSEQQLSFAQHSYLDQFLNGLLPSFNSAVPPRLHSHLTTYCIVKNFNASIVLEQLFSQMTDALSSLDTLDAKKERLLDYQKLLYQLPVEQELALYYNRTSVSDYLITWIEQELKSGYADQKKETLVAADPLSKIHVSVSVPVLALLTRSMKDTGIITNSNLQEVFRFFAAHYTSQRKEAISPTSFHGKYYNVEEGTKRKVTDLLLEMVKAIRKIP